MQKKLLLFLLILHSTKITSVPETITINIYNENSQKTTHTIPIPQELFNPLHKKTPKELIEQLLEICTQHKGKITASILGISYAATLYRILSLSWKVADAQSWTNWHAEIPFEKLYTIPAQTVARELFSTIQERYCAQKESNFLTPLVNFSNDLEAELSALQKLLRFDTWFNILHISFLFPAPLTPQEITAKINRLNYLKMLLVSWISEYSVEQKEPALLQSNSNAVAPAA